MLAAHMDEVGAIVRYITPEGMVKFQLLGGWLDQALADQRWTIMTARGPVTAISGLRSPHITPGAERDRITPRDATLKIPHMGWNTLNVVRAHPLIDGLTLGPDGRHAYFVHSFALNPSQRQDLVADADYGGPVTAIVGRDNIVGTQFHPEKSQKLGLALIANFLKWKP